MSVALRVPAERVWALIGPFDSLPRWHPAVRACSLWRDKDSGATFRRIELHDGGVIVNRLEEHDDRRRVCRYAMVESPLPVSGYTSTLEVREAGPGACVVTWSSSFEPRGVGKGEAVRLIEGVFARGLENLRRVLAP